MTTLRSSINKIVCLDVDCKDLSGNLWIFLAGHTGVACSRLTPMCHGYVNIIYNNSSAVTCMHAHMPAFNIFKIKASYRTNSCVVYYLIIMAGMAVV